MDILSNIYSKSVLENERTLRFWEDYLKSLKDLDLKAFSDKLTVPVLVPIGSRILFRGEVKHTNEVTVSIGADYFAKCSIAQAEVLRQHRIKDAQSKVDIFRKGKEYLENQLSFKKDNLHDIGQEIVEAYSEDEDKTWRKRHRENVRQHKIRSRTEVEQNREEIEDEELWNRLEELELQEELENELSARNTQSPLQRFKLTETPVVKRDDTISPNTNREPHCFPTEIEKEIPNETKMAQVDGTRTPARESKLDLLQKVIDRQNELDERLKELKQKERSRSKTESDLLSRLDEMEQLDELEDEMDRLDNIIEGEGEDSDEEDSIQSSSASVKRMVSFADEDDSETIEITFKHSKVPSSSNGYDPSKGVLKPSDVYSAYPSSFRESTSILKKTKYSDKPFETDIVKQKVMFMQTDEDEENESRTIVVGDVVEKVDQNGNMVQNADSRPTSLFKQKRMQKKS